MNRKFTPRIELEAGAYSAAPADLIIRNEYDKFLDTRRERSSRRRRQILYGLLIFLSAVLLWLAYPIVSTFAVDQLRYIRSASMENTLQTFSYEIKTSALKSTVLPLYSAYAFSADSSWGTESRYAWLIHRYNNDFYGRHLSLSELSEKRLYSWLTYSGLNKLDIAGLNRPFSGDPQISVRDWLIAMSTDDNLHSEYFNPRISELVDEIAYLEDALDREMTLPFTEEQLLEFRRRSLRSDLEPGNSQEVILKALEFIREDPGLAEKMFYLKTSVQERREELDIRLGLAAIHLAGSFRYKGNAQIFGWLSLDKSGAEMMKTDRALDKYQAEYRELKSNYSAYSRHYNHISGMYDRINLEYYEYTIENPIRIGLTVKDVGLFGVRRKTENGYLYEHQGIDLMADRGTPVYPVRDGYVIRVESENDGHGNFVEIWHDNALTTSYSHMHGDAHFDRTLRKFMESGPFWVGTSSRIGSVGTSGNIPKGDPQYGYSHLHLEVKSSRQYKNPFQMLREDITVIH